MHPLSARFLGPVAASRFIPTGPAGGDEVVFTTTMTGSSNGWQTYTIRTLFTRMIAPASANSFRIGFRANTGATLRVSKVFIGSGNDWQFGSTPTQIFFGGNPGATFSSGSTTYCDDVALDYDGTKNLVVSFYIPLDAPPDTFISTNAANYKHKYSFRAGDFANDVGGTWSLNGENSCSIVEVEAFVTDAWNNQFRVDTGAVGSSGWVNYTFRTRYETGVFCGSGFTDFRVGLLNNVSDIFIGNAVSTPGSFEFTATPTRLLFGGANGSVTNQNQVNVTDSALLSILDLGQPVLVSYLNQSSGIFFATTPPSGMSSATRSGDFASVVSGSGFGGYFGWYMGPALVDAT